jgi:ribokinase
MAGAVVVVGSLNMDFVVTVEHLPAPGETVLGRDFQMIPGGKGANQACAAGKLAAGGIAVRMIGRVGCDVFAGQLKGSLSAAGVDVSGIQAARDHPTGVALIWVDGAGQNSIVVAPGANSTLAEADVAAMRELFRGGSHALFQLETPLPTVAAALALARAEGLATVLDPAPAQPLPRGLLEQVDIVTPNESEALLLLGRPPARVTVEDAPALTRELLHLGPRAVILKLGDRGCFYSAGEECHYQAAFPVEARDTTAAGDTFNAALAIALAEGRPMQAALRFAAAAAAICVTRLGAQSSAPNRAETEALAA